MATTTNYVRLINFYVLLDNVLFIETNQGNETKTVGPKKGEDTYALTLTLTFNGGVQKTVTYSPIGVNGSFGGGMYNLTSIWRQMNFQIGISDGGSLSQTLDLSNPALGFSG